MSDHFDALETRDPAARERDLMRRLPQLIAAGLRRAGLAPPSRCARPHEHRITRGAGAPARAA